MAGIYVNDEGTWKLPKSIWVNDGTSTSGSTGWRVCRNVYVNDGGAWKEMMKTVDLTSSKSNLNLWEHVGSPTEPLSLIFNVSSGVEITSSDPTNNNGAPPRTPAFTVGNFPAGSTVIINNNGYISGGGGFGGNGQYQYNRSWYPANVGGTGGIGINKGSSNNYDCTLVNTGTIAGGGGGGGGGPLEYQNPPPCNSIGGIGCTPGGYAPGKWGGDGAGITGYSRTQGGPTYVPSGLAYGVGSGAIAPGGNGGALGDDGGDAPSVPAHYTLRGANGGDGALAIKGDIEIAVSGTIIGKIG